MGKLLKSVIFFCLISAFSAFSQNTQLLDDFNRADNATVGNGWSETETVASGAQIFSNQLILGSTTAGRDYVWRDVSTLYNTVFNTNTGIMEWSWNMRNTRTTPSGFDPGNYGIAFILGATSSNFLTANGYAVVLGNSGTSKNVRLVKFTGGMALNSSVATIIGPVNTFDTEYLTIKINYNPIGNAWSLFVFSSTTTFANPLTATYTQLGSTTTDASFTGNDLMFLGCLYNHSTSGAGEAGYFDNINVPSACLINTEPTVQASNITTSSIGANSMTVSWSRGDGSSCIVIACQGGPVTANPADGGVYAASSTFGSGTLIGTNQYVVYMGSGTSVNITNLLPNTNYQFIVFEYNGSGCTSNFLITSPPSASANTIGCLLASEPTVPSGTITVGTIRSNSLTLSWTRGNGAFCIVICCGANPVSGPPTDGLSYTTNPVYGLGSSTTAGNYVVYSGTGNTTTVSGLMPGITYYFAVFEFNGTGCNTNFLIPSNWSVGNGTTTSTPAYQYYFGNIHSHSAYSDGDLDGVCPAVGASPSCCYAIGKTAVNFDFMGIADHNHNEGPIMTPAYYASGWSQAASFNSANPTFAALYGMEWGTISTGGHITIYGIDKLIGWNNGNYNVYCAKGDYNSLFNYIASVPNAWATLCHPNSNDYGNLANIGYNATWDNAIVGCAVKNGPFNSLNTTYSDPATSTTVSYWTKLLSKGYHLGPTIDLDNHNSNTMGRSSQGRTVALAPSLSPANIMDAFYNMRFYATEDFNLNVDYKVNNSFPMGSIVTQTINPTITVSATDGNGEAITQIRIFYGIPGSGAAPTVLTTSASSTLSFTHSFSSGTYYYYAEIKEADGNTAWTSPVWYTKIITPLPVELISFEGKNTDKGNVLSWTTASEINNDHFLVEWSHDGWNFNMLGMVQGNGTTSSMHHYTLMDTQPITGITYYRLSQYDFDGTAIRHGVIAVRTPAAPEIFTIYPNPSQGDFIISVNDKVNLNDVLITDALGKVIYHSSTLPEKRLLISLETSGIYTVSVSTTDKVEVKRFVVSGK